MPTFTALTARVGNPMVTTAEWNAEVVQNLNTAVWRILAENIYATDLGAIAFTSIPATYRHLMLAYHTRTNATNATQDELGMRFNADLSAVYDYQYHEAVGASGTAGESSGATYLQAGMNPTATAPASSFSNGTIVIPHYADTVTHKGYSGHCSFRTATGASGMRLRQVGGLWRATAAINRIDLFGTSGALLTGTAFTLYGCP